MAVSRLAVGLPVFNGENFLRETLDALRSQTFHDYTLTVADNASTDATPAIVAEEAPTNARVHVLRQPRNLGAAPNYNAAYRAAPPSEYFAWLAHDDVPLPRFLETCVAALDAHPEAIIAFSRTAIIDPNGERIGEFPDRPLLSSPDRAVRLGDVLRHKSNHPIFGVIRRSALDRTRLHASYTGSDRTLLAELALQGPYIEIPEELFHLREHPQRSVRRETSRTRQTREAWFDSSRAGKVVFPHWHRVRDYVTAVFRTPMPVRDRFRCLVEISRVVAAKEWKPMAVDLAVAMRQLAARLAR